MLDKRGHADAYGPDDTLSKSRMLAVAKECLGLADLRAIDAEVAAAQKQADGMTAWRIEGTLREFARFDPVNLWFDYPVHKPDSGLLEDLQPDSDFRTLGNRGVAKRWGTGRSWPRTSQWSCPPPTNPARWTARSLSTPWPSIWA